MSSPAVSLVKVGLLEMLAFRLKPLMTLSGYPVIVVANYCLYSAIFRNSPSVAGYNVNEVLTYMTLAWLLRSVFKTDTDRIMGFRVRSGDISLDLIRPAYYPLLVFWQGLGRTLSRVIFIGIPLAVFGTFVFHLSGPRGPAQLAGFLVSVILGYLMVFSINLIIGVAAFFVEYNLELSWVVDMTVRLLAGLLIPLDFFPDKVASFLLWLPFKYIYFVPIQLYLGRIPTEDILGTLAVGFVWLAALTLLGHVLFVVGTRRLTIQGG